MAEKLTGQAEMVFKARQFDAVLAERDRLREAMEGLMAAVRTLDDPTPRNWKRVRVAYAQAREALGPGSEGEGG